LGNDVVLSQRQIADELQVSVGSVNFVIKALIEKGWYVAFCKPAQEQVAQINAQNQGFDTYLPMLTKQQVNRGKLSVIAQAMFPRYLFLRPSSDEQSVASLKSTRGIVKLVQFGFELGIAPDELIELLREVEASAHKDGPEMLFQQGDRVNVIDGPFKGFVAKVLSKPSERVRLLLEFLGKSQQVSLPPESCRKVEYV